MSSLLEKTCADAARWFRDYEALHRAKGTADGRVKANLNAERAQCLEMALSLPESNQAQDQPIPMRLFCPECYALHIDEGKFSTRPHHTHACQICGAVWRPAIVATVGVQFLPGFKNVIVSVEDAASPDATGLLEPTPQERYRFLCIGLRVYRACTQWMQIDGVRRSHTYVFTYIKKMSDFLEKKAADRDKWRLDGKRGLLHRTSEFKC